jgi:hypothetical protein
MTLDELYGLTFDELYSPAMEIADQVEADRYFEFLVTETQKWRRENGRQDDRRECRRIVRSNLGYYAGYYGSETRRRVERLFRTEHPIFGSVEKDGVPTGEEAYELGVASGKAGKMQVWPRAQARRDAETADMLEGL